MKVKKKIGLKKVTETFNQKTVLALDKSDRLEYMNTCEPSLDEDGRSQLYEANHNRIMNAFIEHIKVYTSSPSVLAIAEATHLSRKTVYKHLTEFKNSKWYQLEKRKQEMIALALIEKLGWLSHRGDMKAARLFLSLTGHLKENNNHLHLHQTKA